MQQRFSVERNRGVVASTIPPCPERAVVCHAVDTYAFLLPEQDREYGAKAFAELIRKYSSQPHVQAIADAVERADEVGVSNGV